MDEIRQKLLEMGFVLKLYKEPFPEYEQPVHVYEWEVHPIRGVVYNIWIASLWHCKFIIERAGYGRESGDEGFAKYVAFKGYVSSLKDFYVILKTTGVLDDINNSSNALSDTTITREKIYKIFKQHENN
jgi:hypothetical protein